MSNPHLVHQPDPTLRVVPLEPLPGTALDPSQVLGRDGDVDRAIGQLAGASLRLNEPRRLGKSSFLTRLAHVAPDGWAVVHQSFQGVGSTQELVERALSGIAGQRRLRTQAREAAKAFLSSGSLKASTPDGLVFELSPAFRTDPLGALTAGLASAAARLAPGEFLVLAWDEVPDMAKAIADAEGPDAAVRALGLLRRLRGEFAASGGRVRWILTGSVGFHHLLRELGRDDLVNDLENLSLGPLDAAWTDHLAERLLRGAGLDPADETVAELARVSAGIPVIAHLLASRAKSAQLEVLEPADVEPLFERVVGDLDEGHQFTSFLTRLNPYYGSCQPGAAWVLDRLVNGPATRAELSDRLPEGLGIGSEDQLREVLGWLEADHYLVAGADGDGGRHLAWRYEPLRRIWELRRR